jgi:predicted nuclease of predicted toxin-antitoxin system
MKIVIDMNLSPQWKRVFVEAGIEAKHWSEIGHPTDDDSIILEWARTEGYVVFTHDLDFSALLASTNAKFPSVFQLRDVDVTPESQGAFIVGTVRAYQDEFESGCLVTIDRKRSRLRILPLWKD